MVTRRLAFSGYLLAGAAALAMLTPPRPARPAEKTENWVEVRSPHFTVISNGNEKQARRTLDQFEQIRGVFHKAFPSLRLDPGKPFVILAAKNENTLKALLPGYWETKGHTHPAGLFLAGQERHYVALRLDVSGENPYHVIYHEYVHMLIALNYRSLPTWLDEGFADFYGNTVIEDKDVGLGRPDESHLILLQQSKLLPIEVLLKVDHSSPYYNEANKTSVFYAESWALVHYYMLDDRVRKEDHLGTFLQLVKSDVDDIEAAKRAFGDLKQLQKTLESYVRQSAFHYAKMKAPAEMFDKDYAVRAVSPAESLAVRGDFQVRTNRPTEAKALLEQALNLDPNLAQAHESMGFLHFRKGEREEAARQFAQAVKLDSRSALAHYYHAMLLVQESMSAESFPEAETSLQRAVELSPGFAPAHAALANLYLRRQESLPKALEAARRAVELEPGDTLYYLNFGQVLLRMDKIDEARAIAQRAMAAPKSPEMRMAASAFLEEINRYQAYLAERKRYEEEARASRAQLQEYLRTQKAESSSSETIPKTDSPAPPAVSARRYSMVGKIAAVSCTSPPAMDLNLTASGITMKLHAANYFKVDYLTTSWQPPANFNPCTTLAGRSAQISYTLAQGKPYDGEIVTIEVRK